jgi:hypothetical protein
MYHIFYMHKHFDIITNPFKYKYETCQIFIHPFQKIVMNTDRFNNEFNTFKVNDSSHVQMLIIQKM